jgi:hypothetical protein
MQTQILAGLELPRIARRKLRLVQKPLWPGGQSAVRQVQAEAGTHVVLPAQFELA